MLDSCLYPFLISQEINENLTALLNFLWTILVKNILIFRLYQHNMIYFLLITMKELFFCALKSLYYLFNWSHICRISTLEKALFNTFYCCYFCVDFFFNKIFLNCNLSWPIINIQAKRILWVALIHRVTRKLLIGWKVWKHVVGLVDIIKKWKLVW